MLWKKGWWETRWPFLVCLAVIFLAYGFAYGWGDYDAARWAADLQRRADLSESERQALNNYQGHTWALWFKLLFTFIWANLAVAMGAGCLMTACPWTPSQGAAGLFTFSLPASRRKVLLSQAAVGFGEMFLFALIPSLLLPIIARFRGQWFSWSDTMIYMLLMIFAGAALFFALGGSAIAVNDALRPQARCQPGAMRGFVTVNGDAAKGMANFPDQLTSARPLIGARMSA